MTSKVKYQHKAASVIDKFRRNIYTHNFRVNGSEFVCEKTSEKFRPEDLIIDEIFIFEGNAGTEDTHVVYGITAYSGTRGVISDVYGAYSNPVVYDFIKKVQVR